MTMKVTPEQALHQCLVWYGMGTGGVPTKQEAVDDLMKFFTYRFKGAFKNDPKTWSDEDDAHVLQRLFILRCSEAIGSLAAQLAAGAGKLSIALEHVRKARSKVIKANSEGPGPFCS